MQNKRKANQSPDQSQKQRKSKYIYRCRAMKNPWSRKSSSRKPSKCGKHIDRDGEETDPQMI
jgi:hypothetical protein